MSNHETSNTNPNLAGAADNVSSNEQKVPTPRSHSSSSSSSHSSHLNDKTDVPMVEVKSEKMPPTSGGGGGGEGVKLKAQITLLNGITIIVGCIIGSGIFVSPAGVQQQVGSVGASLMVWVFGGIYSMIGAYCYAELGCMIRKSGADYAYLMEAFGGAIGFLRLWIECIIVRPVTITIMSLTFANYLVAPFFLDCDRPQDAVRLFAIISITILTFVNCYSVRLAMLVQDLFTYAKILALILIIVTGIVQLCRGYTDAFNDAFAGSSSDPSDYALAIYSSLFAYQGWNYLNYVIEEMKNPRRDLPIAIAISIPLCMVIYVLANIAYYTTVAPEEMLLVPVAITFSQRLYAFMWWIMPVFVSLSCFGSMNGVLFTTSRLFYCGAREGHMPQLLAMVQTRRLTPAPACLFTGIMAMIYLVSTDIFQLINYLSFAGWLAIGVSAVALLYFRKKYPNWERPIKVSLFFPILYIILTVVLISLPFLKNPSESLIGVLMILSALPVYWIFVCWNKPKSFVSTINRVTVFLQKILLTVPEDKRTD